MAELNPEHETIGEVETCFSLLIHNFKKASLDKNFYRLMVLLSGIETSRECGESKIPELEAAMYEKFVGETDLEWEAKKAKGTAEKDGKPGIVRLVMEGKHAYCEY